MTERPRLGAQLPERLFQQIGRLGKFAPPPKRERLQRVGVEWIDRAKLFEQAFEPLVFSRRARQRQQTRLRGKDRLVAGRLPGVDGALHVCLPIAFEHFRAG